MMEPVQAVWETQRWGIGKIMRKLMRSDELFDDMYYASESCRAFCVHAQKFIIRRRLYEITRLERQGGRTRLTICNLWRLTRFADQSGLMLEEFEPLSGQWRETGSAGVDWKFSARLPRLPEHGQSIWPDLACSKYDDVKVNSLLADGLTISSALAGRLWQILGGTELDEPERLETWNFFDEAEFSFMHEMLDRAREIKDVGGSWEEYQYLEQNVFRNQIIDQSILADLVPLYRADDPLRLSEYLSFSSHRPGLAGWAAEAPDFAPLLRLIPVKFWGRRDLMSDRALGESESLLAALPARSLRGLRKMPAEALLLVVRYRFRPDLWPDLVEASVRLNLDGRLPLAIQRPILEMIFYILRFTYSPEEYSKSKILADIFLRDHLRLFLKIGQGPFEEYWGRELEDFDFGLLLDYLKNENPLDRSVGRQATWRSLLRRSAEWHERVWQEEYAEEEQYESAEDYRKNRWESLVGETELDGFHINPLTSGLALFEEGRKMRHCVGTYAGRCLNKGLRIFSMTGPDGSCSTLSLNKNGACSWRVEQHYGPGNSPVSAAALKTGLTLARLYGAAEQAERAKRAVERKNTEHPQPAYKPKKEPPASFLGLPWAEAGNILDAAT